MVYEFSKETKAHRFYRIYKTVNEMLYARGYIVEDKILTMTFDEFLAKYYSGESVLVTSSSNVQDDFNETKLNKTYVSSIGDPNIFVFYNRTKPANMKVVLSNVQEYKDTLSNQNTSFKVIGVLKEPLTSSASKQLDQNARMGGNIEIFKEEDLLINITKHELVPLHEKLNNNEREEVLKKYKLTLDKLPMIRRKDPVARFLGLKRDDVVRITRPSETVGSYVSYRVTVDD